MNPYNSKLNVVKKCGQLNFLYKFYFYTIPCETVGGLSVISEGISSAVLSGWISSSSRSSSSSSSSSSSQSDFVDSTSNSGGGLAVFSRGGKGVANLLTSEL